MKPRRLLFSAGLLMLGVGLWSGFFGQRKEVPVAAPAAPAVPALTHVSPMALPPAIQPALDAPAPAAANATMAPASPAQPGLLPSTHVQGQAIVPAPASSTVRLGDVPPPSGASGSAVLFAPAGSVVSETQPVAPAAAFVVRSPLPTRSLSEDVASTDPALAPEGEPKPEVQRTRAARALAAKRRIKEALPRPQQSRQASSFEHPLGVR